MSLDFTQHPHRRLNILTGEWVQVSPHRTKRPWQGQQEETAENHKPEYAAGCYLCPGNERAGEAQNPEYISTFSFVNDFSALKPDSSDDSYNEQDLLISKGERGLCKVVCFSPRHDLTLPEMELSQIEEVVALWVKEYEELGAKDFINYVQIFENKGEVMGCSNPHPHGQIWAQETIPDEPAKELIQFKKHFKKTGKTLLSEYLNIELDKRKRVVVENDHFAVVVPFWAFWPFETLVISKRPFARLTDMSKEEEVAFAHIIQKITIKYDNVFKVSFPYSAGLHPAPTDGQEHREWHFHMHFYPPLLRSAAIKKFRVGYEMLANPQRDVTAEYSAGLLRDLPEIHYKKS
jgi:UDPglucose--hexose-1-phosphate uridylyltransferase